MKLIVVGFYKKHILENQIKKFGFKIDKRNPDIAIAYGGEGTCLWAEQIYPNLPKLFLRHSSKCRNCKNHRFNNILKLLKNRKFKILNLTKVEANVNGRKVSGMNEINLHYSPPRALRFLLKLNNKIISKELVGDGIVVATPYGSTGYFYSITGRNFNRGLGIAFNNSTKRMKAIITGENSKIHVKILREKGVVCADTNDKIIKIRKGNVILIKKSDKKARMIKLNGNNLKVDIK